jgi:hypothetical protein
LAASTIQFFQAGGEGVRMWHDLFVEQITLSEKVIRTIEDSGGQLTSSRTGWLLNIADAIWCGHMEPPRGAVFTRLRTQPMLGS